MALRTSVIVNGINNLSDARYCAGMGADMIGFNLRADDAERVQPETLKEMTGWVAGVQLAGEFAGSTAAEINRLSEEFNLDIVQLDAPYTLEEVKQIGRPVILQIKVAKNSTASELEGLLADYQGAVHAFLLSSSEIGALDETITPLLAALAGRFPVYIGFGIGKDNIHHVLNNIRPTGIGLRGGHEIKPGLKDFDELQDIFEEIEEE